MILLGLILVVLGVFIMGLLEPDSGPIPFIFFVCGILLIIGDVTCTPKEYRLEKYIVTNSYMGVTYKNKAVIKISKPIEPWYILTSEHKYEFINDNGTIPKEDM